MEKFIDWFVNNLPISIILVICVLSLVLIILILSKLCFKNSKALLSLLSQLPTFINDAEIKGFTSGEGKLTYVLQCSLSYLMALTGKSAEAVSKKYLDLVKSYIENILSTPQKKGDN